MLRLKVRHGCHYRKLRTRAALPAERFFFRTSLSLLVLTSTITPRQYRQTRHRDQLCGSSCRALQKAFAGGMTGPPNSSHRARDAGRDCLYGRSSPWTRLILSRGSRWELRPIRRSSPRFWPPCIFLIFVSIVRFYSAVTDRDALFSFPCFRFAGILAAGRSHRGYDLPGSFLHLFVVRYFHVRWNGIAPWSHWRGFRPRFTHTRNANRSLNRALSPCCPSVSRPAQSFLGGVLFFPFFFPRFSAGYLGRASFQPPRSCPVSRKTWNLAKSARSRRIPPVVMRVANRQAPLATIGCVGAAIALINFRRPALDLI